MALLDRFGRVHDYLRVSVTDRCDLRCAYCMPEEGIDWRDSTELLTFEEIERVVSIFVQQGVRKVRLTGGEPLIRPELPTLVAMLRKLPGLETIAITTNATHLARDASSLKRAGLDKITVSLDTLHPARFAAITHRDRFAEVWRGIEAAIAEGFLPLKLNVVLMARVNDDEVLDFVRLSCERPIIVRFIEFMPFKENGWSTTKLISYRDLLQQISREFTLQPVESSSRSDVAKEYTVNGGLGRIGFITSMTEDFCSTCNRMRLTADGAIKSCLHDGAEFSIRDLMRSGATQVEIENVIRRSLAGKQERHAGIDELYQIENRTMIQIGG